MRFHYHAYGKAVGSLRLEWSSGAARDGKGPSWEAKGNRGDVWHMAAVVANLKSGDRVSVGTIQTKCSLLIDIKSTFVMSITNMRT